MEKQDFRKVQTNTFPAILPGLQHCPGTGGSGSGYPKIRGQTPVRGHRRGWYTDPPSGLLGVHDCHQTWCFRNDLMEKNKDLFGKKFILMPNPTDGHWVRAIFGESEPAPTKQNRQTWKKAAEKQQSRGIREHMGKWQGLFIKQDEK